MSSVDLDSPEHALCSELLRTGAESLAFAAKRAEKAEARVAELEAERHATKPLGPAGERLLARVAELQSMLEKDGETYYEACTLRARVTQLEATILAVRKAIGGRSDGTAWAVGRALDSVSETKDSKGAGGEPATGLGGSSVVAAERKEAPRPPAPEETLSDTEMWCVTCGKVKVPRGMGTCTGCAVKDMLQRPSSPRLRELAQKAVEACEARKDDDVDEWAERLAADSVAAGEAEYGPTYGQRTSDARIDLGDGILLTPAQAKSRRAADERISAMARTNDASPSIRVCHLCEWALPDCTCAAGRQRLIKERDDALAAWNSKEAERRAHRDAMQAWANSYAVDRPANPPARDIELWKACTQTFMMRVPLVAGPRTTEATPGPGRPWNAMPKFDFWVVEREIIPPLRQAGRSYHADLICEVHPTEARYGDPARTAEENAKRIADALNDAEGWYGPATEAAHQGTDYPRSPVPCRIYNAGEGVAVIRIGEADFRIPYDDWERASRFVDEVEKLVNRPRPETPVARVEVLDRFADGSAWTLLVNGQGIATWPCNQHPHAYADEVARALREALETGSDAGGST